MIETLSNPILSVMIPILIIVGCIIFKDGAVYSKKIPIFLCILSMILWVLLPLYRWSVSVFVIFSLIILIGVERSVMLEAKTYTYSKFKVKRKVMVITAVISLLITGFLMWFVFSNKYTYIEAGNEFRTSLALLIMVFLIFSFIYCTLIIFLLHYINPLRVLKKQKNIGRITNYFEVFFHGRRAQNSFYRYCVRFENDETYYFVKKKLFLDFLKNLDAIYEYDILTGLFGINFVRKVPKMISKINVDSDIENTMKYYSSLGDWRKRQTIAIMEICSGINMLIMSQFIMFAFYFGYTNGKEDVNSNLPLIYCTLFFLLIVAGLIITLKGIYDYKKIPKIRMNRVEIGLFEQMKNNVI